MNRDAVHMMMTRRIAFVDNNSEVTNMSNHSDTSDLDGIDGNDGNSINSNDYSHNDHNNDYEEGDDSSFASSGTSHREQHYKKKPTISTSTKDACSFFFDFDDDTRFRLQSAMRSKTSSTTKTNTSTSTATRTIRTTSMIHTTRRTESITTNVTTTTTKSSSSLQHSNSSSAYVRSMMSNERIEIQRFRSSSADKTQKRNKNTTKKSNGTATQQRSGRNDNTKKVNIKSTKMSNGTPTAQELMKMMTTTTAKTRTQKKKDILIRMMNKTSDHDGTETTADISSSSYHMDSQAEEDEVRCVTSSSCKEQKRHNLPLLIGNSIATRGDDYIKLLGYFDSTDEDIDNDTDDNDIDDDDSTVDDVDDLTVDDIYYNETDESIADDDNVHVVNKNNDDDDNGSFLADIDRHFASTGCCRSTTSKDNSTNKNGSLSSSSSSMILTSSHSFASSSSSNSSCSSLHSLSSESPGAGEKERCYYHKNTGGIHNADDNDDDADSIRHSPAPDCSPSFLHCHTSNNTSNSTRSPSTFRNSGDVSPLLVASSSSSSSNSSSSNSSNSSSSNNSSTTNNSYRRSSNSTSSVRSGTNNDNVDDACLEDGTNMESKTQSFAGGDQTFNSRSTAKILTSLAAQIVSLSPPLSPSRSRQVHNFLNTTSNKHSIVNNNGSRMNQPKRQPSCSILLERYAMLSPKTTPSAHCTNSDNKNNVLANHIHNNNSHNTKPIETETETGKAEVSPVATVATPRSILITPNKFLLNLDNKKGKKTVRFEENASVREYALTVGACTWVDSCPLQLSWEHSPTKPVPLKRASIPSPSSTSLKSVQDRKDGGGVTIGSQYLSPVPIRNRKLGCRISTDLNTTIVSSPESGQQHNPQRRTNTPRPRRLTLQERRKRLAMIQGISADEACTVECRNLLDMIETTQLRLDRALSGINHDHSLQLQQQQTTSICEDPEGRNKQHDLVVISMRQKHHDDHVTKTKKHSPTRGSTI